MGHRTETPRTRGGRLVTNTAVFTVGKFISKLLVFFMMRLYTSCLSTSEYSTVDLIVNMANLLIPLACLGIGEGIFRSVAAKTGDKEAFFTNGLCILGVGLVAFLALSPLLSLIPMFTGVAWLIVLYVIASNFHAVVSQYLCAVGDTKLFAGQGILNTVLVIVLNIVFLPVLDLGVTGYVLSIILADTLTTLFLIVYRRVWRAFKPRTVSWGIMSSMLRFCLPLIPATVFWWITGVSDRYMVAYMTSPTQNGLYAAAYKVPTLLIYVVSIFDSAWKLSVSEEDGGDDQRSLAEQGKFFTGVWRMYTTVAFLGGAALILGCRLFAGMIYAEEFSTAWIYIPILTTATVYTALDTFLGSVYYASRRTVGSMLTALIGAVLNVILNFLLIPEFGAMGASVATFASYFAVFMIRLASAPRYIPFEREMLRNTVNTALLCILTVTVTLTDRGHAVAWWCVSAVVALGMLLVNIRTVMEICRSVLRLFRGKR